MNNTLDKNTATLSATSADSRPETQRSLQVYGIYRIILAALLLLVFLVQSMTVADRAHRPDLFLLTVVAYFLASIATHIYASIKHYELRKPAMFLLFFVIDIVALTLIAHASGGLSGGLSLLMTLTVATAGIFFRDELAILVAALASIAVVLNGAYLAQLEVTPKDSLLATGLLGAIFFATALLIQRLANRIDVSQELAAQKTKALSYTQHLNHLIVQRMQTGVVVVNKQFAIHSANQSAIELLQLPSPIQADRLTLPKALLSRLKQWQERPHVRTTPFQLNKDSAHVQAEFMPLTSEDSDNILVFLEDTRRAHQQAQQIKLASLGRLTASIAHEIRNPLSAINHAAQLMNESETIVEDDQKLCGIITKHSARMNRTIENVLQLSRRHAANPQRIPLKNWLTEFIASLEHNQPTANIDLECDSGRLFASFDPSQLDQVLTNLCSNGLRYSERATGKPHLLLRVATHPRTKIPYLEVIDDGNGIEKKQQEQLFEPFYTSEKNGTGLGLFIAKELCEANQSRLNYWPTTSNKSCFRVSFAHPQRKLSDADPTRAST